MRTGIYGGTFSPPHNGHIAAARAFISQLCLDELLIIPDAIPPHKQLEYADNPVQRFEMCSVAFGRIDRARVSDIELERGGKSYTSDTLAALSEEGRTLFLLCGTDMIMTLEDWHRPEEIFSLCTPVCVRRENSPGIEKLLMRRIAYYKRKYGVKIPLISAPAIELSSSELRYAVRSGKSIEGLVPDEVAEYILRTGMYK